PVWEPAIDGLAVSVAEIDCVPAVSRRAANWGEPLSAAGEGEATGTGARGALLLKGALAPKVGVCLPRRSWALTREGAAFAAVVGDGKPVTSSWKAGANTRAVPVTMTSGAESCRRTTVKV